MPARPDCSFTCDDSRALLGPYLDGELALRVPDGDAAGNEGLSSDAAELETHLLGCPACASELRALRHIKQAVRTAASQHAPAALRRSVLDALDKAPGPEAAEAPPGDRLGRLLHRLNPRHVALAAAAAGVVAWFAHGGLTRPVFDLGGRNVLEDGIAQHARTLPLDYAASDAGLVQRWLEGKLDFGVRLPHFAPAEVQPELRGVRLSTVRSRPAAMVTYTVSQGHEGRRLSLLIVDDDQRDQLPGQARLVGGHAVFVSQSRGYNMATWRNGEIVYSLISDLDEGDILRLVAAAQQR